MELMKSYSDLLIEIELTKDQLDYAKYEYKYWSGIDLDKGEGVPLGGAGSHKHGTETALIQIGRKEKAYNRLVERLETLEGYKERMDRYFEQFDGRDYKVAYMKYVEFKPLQEIADELNLSLDTIKQISSRLSKQYKSEKLHFIC